MHSIHGCPVICSHKHWIMQTELSTSNKNYYPQEKTVPSLSFPNPDDDSQWRELLVWTPPCLSITHPRLCPRHSAHPCLTLRCKTKATFPFSPLLSSGRPLLLPFNGFPSTNIPKGQQRIVYIF